MSTSVSVGQKASIAFVSIAWFALALFALLGLAVVALLPWWMILALVAAGIVLGLVFFVVRWLWKRRDPAWNGRSSMAAFSAAGVLATIGFVAVPVFYLAYFVDSGPLSIPLAKLSNGKKTVVFQGMQHVGSEEFFKGVVFDLEKALADGYTLFYEGVQPVAGKPELTTWFNETLRGETADLSTTYKAFSQGCGLSFQLDYFATVQNSTATDPVRHVTADANYGQMKEEFDRLTVQDPGYPAAVQAEHAASKSASSGGDPMMQIVTFAAGATDGQKRLLGIACRGILAMSTSKPETPSPTSKIILDFRNRVLARFVAESPADKIYITYGAAHLPGFTEELKKLDPSFELRSLVWGRAMSIPRSGTPIGMQMVE